LKQSSKCLGKLLIQLGSFPNPSNRNESKRKDGVKNLFLRIHLIIRWENIASISPSHSIKFMTPITPGPLGVSSLTDASVCIRKTSLSSLILFALVCLESLSINRSRLAFCTEKYTLKFTRISTILFLTYGQKPKKSCTKAATKR